MHELGVVFSVIKQVEKIGEENAVSNVDKVVLELGEVSTVIPEYLEDCWKWAVKRTEIMQQAELEIRIIDAVTFCENCEKEYPTVKHGRVCPYCGSEKTYLLKGNEFIIKEISAELRENTER